ncbi:DUF881 domain-containing protein [Luedemannella helvata]|uniref:DUF881 domain-containing protein n=1 Tax=Luedemannella helvata TaxID=349315 RepID=A0ABN2KAU4_9ACTN
MSAVPDAYPQLTPADGERHVDSGLGWPQVPEASAVEPAPEATQPEEVPAEEVGPEEAPPVGEASGAGRRRLSAAGAVIGLLVGLLGFALVVQLRSNTGDAQLQNTRPEDLVRILSDLNAREERLRSEIGNLQLTRSQLASGAQGREAALAEARRRADELGILAGTLPAVGEGLRIQLVPDRDDPIKAATVLDAVEELRGAGAEAMQITGNNGASVRIVASTYFVDSSAGLTVDGTTLTAPYTITVIGPAQTMSTALTIPGGVADAVQRDGGNVIVDNSGEVHVDALHSSSPLRWAQPVS